MIGMTITTIDGGTICGTLSDDVVKGIIESIARDPFCVIGVRMQSSTTIHIPARAITRIECRTMAAEARNQPE